jgi:hypothetical protein
MRAAIPSETVALLEPYLAEQAERQPHLLAAAARDTLLALAALALQETLAAAVVVAVAQETDQHLALVELAAMAA